MGGTVIEGAQVVVGDLPRAEQGGASELVPVSRRRKTRFNLAKANYLRERRGNVRPHYLVIRQDQIQACEFVLPEVLETDDQIRDSFRWEWDE